MSQYKSFSSRLKWMRQDKIRVAVPVMERKVNRKMNKKKVVRDMYKVTILHHRLLPFKELVVGPRGELAFKISFKELTIHPQWHLAFRLSFNRLIIDPQLPLALGFKFNIAREIISTRIMVLLKVAGDDNGVLYQASYCLKHH
ncbi:hypothetical protein V8E55_010019 [Tylopilus felleus]